MGELLTWKHPTKTKDNIKEIDHIDNNEIKRLILMWPLTENGEWSIATSTKKERKKGVAAGLRDFSWDGTESLSVTAQRQEQAETRFIVLARNKQKVSKW